jgi:hypothetical protein
VISQVLRVAWYRLRATFGRRWGGYLSLVLLIGLIGRVAVGAGAAASVNGLILVNLVAAWPGRAAARTPPALALRTE